MQKVFLAFIVCFTAGTVHNRYCLLHQRWLQANYVACRWSLIAGCRLPVAGQRLLVAGCRWPVAGGWLLGAGCWLLVTDCWLLVAGFEDEVMVVTEDYPSTAVGQPIFSLGEKLRVISQYGLLLLLL